MTFRLINSTNRRMSAKEIIETKVAKRLSENPEKAKSIGQAVAIVLTGEGGGRWIIDCGKDPAQIMEDKDSPAVTTISMEAKDFEKMATGELNPQMAFMAGKVKVDGSLGTAIKLGQLLT